MNHTQATAIALLKQQLKTIRRHAAEVESVHQDYEAAESLRRVADAISESVALLELSFQPEFEGEGFAMSAVAEDRRHDFDGRAEFAATFGGRAVA